MLTSITHLRFLSIILYSIITLSLNACGDTEESEFTDNSMLEAPEIYLQNCSVCHGEFGEGKNGRALNTPHIDEMTDGQLFTMIYEGIGTVMPSFRSSLTTEQIVDVVRYIRTFRD